MDLVNKLDILANFIVRQLHILVDVFLSRIRDRNLDYKINIKNESEHKDQIV